MLIDWPHLPNTWLSIIKYYPSTNTPLPLRNSKYKWYQQVLVGGLLSPPTLRIGHFRRTITRPEGWKLDIALCVDGRGFSQPYLRCLIPNKANYIMREVHEKVCGNHSRARSLVHKLVRPGYIGLPCKWCPILRKSMWQAPTLQQDLMAKQYERKPTGT